MFEGPVVGNCRDEEVPGGILETQLARVAHVDADSVAQTQEDGGGGLPGVAGIPKE